MHLVLIWYLMSHNRSSAQQLDKRLTERYTILGKSEKDGHPINILAVVCGPCKVCGNYIKQDSLYYAIGEPYFTCIHTNCLPRFKFDGMYRNSKPLCFYKK